jgi:hypothetical protein
VCRGKVMKMERVADSESKRNEFDIVTDTEEVTRVVPKNEAKRIYRAPRNTVLYAKPLSGFVAIVALLFVPMITLPGMVILVLVAEVYLLDWTYSKVGLLRDARLSFSNETTERGPEDEIDKRIERPSPKHQFIK